MTEFEKSVYNITKKVPRGMVTTYASIACAAGKSRAARAVGNALNKNPFCDVPCHRVVRSDGKVGGFSRGSYLKLNLLKKEGVKISGCKVHPKLIII